MTKIKTFGPKDYNQYWQKRRENKKTGLSEIHKITIDIVEKNKKPNSKILDLGVGPGHVFKHLQEKKYDCYGIEIAEEAFKMYDFPADKIKKGDFTKNIPDFDNVNYFDVIIANAIIHHLTEPEEMFKKIKKRMDKNSILIFFTPNVSFWLYRVKYFFKGEFPDLSPQHRNFLTPYEFEKMLKEEGFEIKEIRTMGRHKILLKIAPFLFSGGLFFVCQVKE